MSATTGRTAAFPAMNQSPEWAGCAEGIRATACFRHHFWALNLVKVQNEPIKFLYWLMLIRIPNRNIPEVCVPNPELEPMMGVAIEPTRWLEALDHVFKV